MAEHAPRRALQQRERDAISIPERIAVLGDLSGHTVPLYRALEQLGVDLGAMRVPRDLTVVQLGDLVHRGPDGDEAVAFVDEMMGRNPTRWVQLLGNHEAQHVDGPGFGLCDCTAQTATTIRHWVRTGRAGLAFAAEVAEIGPVLISHAGLSAKHWRGLGAPAQPAAALVALEHLAHTDRLSAYAGGEMLGIHDGDPGVLWAEAGAELYAAWLGRHPPFSQVHGHSSAYHWDARRFSATMPEALQATTVLDVQARHLRVRIGGQLFVGIDPCFGRRRPSHDLTPLVLERRP